MFIFYSLLESTPEISQSTMDVQEPGFGLNGTRLPKNEWKSISIRNIHSVCVGRYGLAGAKTPAGWPALSLSQGLILRKLVLLDRLGGKGRQGENQRIPCIHMLLRSRDFQKSG
jgi:hypothetical protein